MSRVVTAFEMAEGEGARVKRLFPTMSFRDLDPFVLFDEFSVRPDAGFPEHPHGGFEAITYMLGGAFRHRDNMGNDTVVGKGGAQHFSAGSGLVHAEMPGTPDQVSHGIQLWINLPRQLKRMEPEYGQFDSVALPLSTPELGVQIRTIVGPGSPLRVHTPLTYRHMQFERAMSYQADIPEGWSGILYVLQGSVAGRGFDLEPGKACVVVGGEEILFETSRDTGLIVVAGLPLGEPIRHRGSYVD